jgi:hypothetical protein
VRRNQQSGNTNTDTQYVTSNTVFLHTLIFQMLRENFSQSGLMIGDQSGKRPFVVPVSAGPGERNYK